MITITLKDLRALARNCEMSIYMRSCVGSALCRIIYDPANCEDDYPGIYSGLYDATFYNIPDENDMILAVDYCEECLQLGLDSEEISLDID